MYDVSIKTSAITAEDVQRAFAKGQLMYNISVQRLPEDPEAQGVISAQDGSWQLVVDKDGFPHLWVRAKLEGGGAGMIAIETFMGGASIRDIMLSEFGGELTDPEEIEAAQAEWDATRKEHGTPAPRG